MKLIISGESKEVQDGITIAELIREEKVKYPAYVTVSVNAQFPKSAEYESYVLKDGDQVEFLYYMGGGK